MLNARQRKFVSLYVDGPDAFNAKKCGVQAGYSESSIPTVMRSPRVQDEIASRTLALQVRFQITGDDVRNGLARIAFHPLGGSEGGPSYSEQKEALVALGKSLGLFSETTLHVGVSLAELLAAAKEREAALPPAQVPERLRLIQGGRAT